MSGTEREPIKIDYKIGDPDYTGNKVNEIFYTDSNNFIIYSSGKTNKLDYSIENSERMAMVAQVESKIANIIASYPHKKKFDYWFNQRLASAIMCSIHNDIDEANIILSRLDVDLNILRKSRGRMQYFIGFIIPIIFVYILNKISAKMIPIDSLYLIVFGGIGGLLSICTRIKDLDFDCNSGFWTNVLDGLQKFLVSSISSVVLFSAVKYKVIGGIVSENMGIYGTILICIAGGFSERFVPNILEQFTQKEKSKATTTSDD